MLVTPGFFESMFWSYSYGYPRYFSLRPIAKELSPFASEIFLPYGAWMVRALAAVARGFGGSVGGAGAVRTTADLGCSGPRF